MTTIRLSNRIAFIALALIIYLVFSLAVILVFELKVFNENMTILFGYTIIGVFLILLGAIVMNVMLNLTSIAESQAGIPSSITTFKYPKITIMSGIMVFFVIFAALYLLNQNNERKRESYLVNTANQLVEKHSAVFNRMTAYQYSMLYLSTLKNDLTLLLKIEERLPNAIVLVADEVDGQKVILGLGRNSYYYTDEETDENVLYSKRSHIFSTSQEERNYLFSVFDGNTDEYKYSSHDEKFELYFPIQNENGKIVLYLNKTNSRYAK